MLSILDTFKSNSINALDDSMLRVQTTLGNTCVDMHRKDEAGSRARAKGVIELILYRKLQSAYPGGSMGIGHSVSGKGRPSTVVLNQIQSRLYSKNMSLLVPKTRKKMYAAPGTVHQNNQNSSKFADPRATKGSSPTVESLGCIVRQSGSGTRPDSTMVLI